VVSRDRTASLGKVKVSNRQLLCHSRTGADDWGVSASEFVGESSEAAAVEMVVYPIGWGFWPPLGEAGNLDVTRVSCYCLEGPYGVAEVIVWRSGAHFAPLDGLEAFQQKWPRTGQP